MTREHAAELLRRYDAGLLTITERRELVDAFVIALLRRAVDRGELVDLATFDPSPAPRLNGRPIWNCQCGADNIADAEENPAACCWACGRERRPNAADRARLASETGRGPQSNGRPGA